MVNAPRSYQLIKAAVFEEASFYKTRLCFWCLTFIACQASLKAGEWQRVMDGIVAVLSSGHGKLVTSNQDTSLLPITMPGKWPLVQGSSWLEIRHLNLRGLVWGGCFWFGSVKYCTEPSCYKVVPAWPALGKRLAPIAVPSHCRPSLVTWPWKPWFRLSWNETNVCAYTNLCFESFS